MAIYIFCKSLAEDVNDRFAGVELDAIESLEEGEGDFGLDVFGGGMQPYNSFNVLSDFYRFCKEAGVNW